MMEEARRLVAMTAVEVGTWDWTFLEVSPLINTGNEGSRAEPETVVLESKRQDVSSHHLELDVWDGNGREGHPPPRADSNMALFRSPDQSCGRGCYLLSF